MSASNWLGKQINGYVKAQIPSWSSLSNNPMAKSVKAPLPDKPDLTTNFIYVGDLCIVQASDFQDPFTVKAKYV